jgi:hypothetical protein
MAETIRQAEMSAVLAEARRGLLTAAERQAALREAQRQLGRRTLTEAELNAALDAACTRLGRELTAQQADALVLRTLLSTPTDVALSVPWLRDFIGTELYSAGIMTMVSVYQRHHAGTLAETTPQVAADAVMDLTFMFFAIMRSPSRVARVAQVQRRHQVTGTPALYVAHSYTQSAAMLTPIVAISSAAGAAGTVMMGEEAIDTPEKWERYLRQSRNRILFDINHIALNSPARASLREGAYEQFGGGGNIGRLLVNGYYIFDFTVLCYPLYIYGRDALGLDRLPEPIRRNLGDGRVFMTIRGPDMPDPNDALLPSVSGVLERFAFGN